jgi:hypothetical protein
MLLSPVLITSGAELKIPAKGIQDELHVDPESCFVYIPPSKPIPKNINLVSARDDSSNRTFKSPSERYPALAPRTIIVRSVPGGTIGPNTEKVELFRASGNHYGLTGENTT